MNNESKKNFMMSIAILQAHDLRKYALKKVAENQSPNDQEENALWCDFIDCLQEAAKATMGVDMPDLTQNEVEGLK